MRRVLLEVRMDPASATLEHARDVLGLEPHQVDARFGLIGVDRDTHSYAMKVDIDVAERVSGASYNRVGAAANPAIRLVE